MQSNVFSTNKTLVIRGKLIDLSKPRVMGILNITPDSFFDGGHYDAVDLALKRCEKMLAEGAFFIDVGGYSTRPGAADVPEEVELSRVLPVIKKIVQHFPEALISIDTFRSAVATAAVAEGACLVNDVSGGNADRCMFETVASLNVPYVLMHSRGNPQTMTTLTEYEDVVRDVAFELSAKVNQLHALGVKDILVDPGLGFAKTVAQNFTLLNQLDYLKILGKPMLVGLSRKSMIWRTLAIKPEESLNGTTVLNTLALVKGASILRVHDVKEAMECVQLLGNFSNLSSSNE